MMPDEELQAALWKLYGGNYKLSKPGLDAIRASYCIFICTGCGQVVVSLPPQDPAPTVCATCQWLDAFIDDPAEREELRRHLTA